MGFTLACPHNMAESLGSNRRLLVVGQSSVQSDSDPDCGIEFLQEIVQATSSRRHVGQPLITIEIYRVILRPEPFGMYVYYNS